MNPEEKNKIGANKRCCYGFCKSDTRTKDYYEKCNFYFIAFPKPCLPFKQRKIEKSKLPTHIKRCAKCRKSARWVRLCGRSDVKFNSINNVSKDSYICSLHFVGESGPTQQFPDPVKYVSSNITKKIPYKQRRSLEEKYQEALNTKYKLYSQKKELNGTKSENINQLKFISVNKVLVKANIEEQNNTIMKVFPAALEKDENSLGLASEESQINAIRTETNLTAMKSETIARKISKKSVSVQTPKMFLNPKKQLERLKKSNSTFESSLMQNFEQSLEQDNTKCLFYTGLEFTKVKLLLFFLSPACNNLIYWNSDGSNFNVENAEERKFTLRQELIITLTHLRCALPLQDLAYRFGTSVVLVTSIIITWVQLMYLEFSKHVKPSMFVSRQQIAENMPSLFKEFKNLRVIIMCTELYCPSPPLLNFEHHDHAYSKKQSSIICKALIGCTPLGAINFVSPVYEGPTSNREIFIKSKMTDLLEQGDLVLVNKELIIKDLIECKRAELRIPPFLERDHCLSFCNDLKTVIIKKQRSYVEQVVGRVKQFRILQEELPPNMKGIMSQLLFVCVCVVNMNLS